MKSLRSLYYWTLVFLYLGPVLLAVILRSYFQSPEVYDPWLRRRLHTLFRLLKTTPKVIFETPLPRDKAFVFMANHASLIDIPLLKAVIPVYFRGILAHPQFNYFLYGTTIRRMGNIAIHRDNIRASLASFRQAGKLLTQGISITVLPEGGRSADGKLMPFKLLPFKFVKEQQVCLIPLSISGTFAMKNKSSWHLSPNPLTIRFGKPITAAESSRLKEAELAALTRKRILAGLIT